MPLADSAPERTASAWDAFYAAWVDPVVRFGTPALVVFVLLLLATRVLSKVVVGAREAGLGRWRQIAYGTGLFSLALVAVDGAVTLPLAFQDTPHRTVQTMLWITVGLVGGCGAVAVTLFAERVQTRDVAVYGGAALIAFAVFGIAVAFPDKWNEPLAVVVWSLILAVLGTVVTARVRGLELGLRIEAHDKTGADDIGLGEYLRVRLHALGTAPPQGIALTQQTDVTSLPDTALTLLPDGVLAKAVAFAVQFFRRATPWRAVVTEQADGKISIVLLRNGRIAEAVVVRPALLELDTDEPDEANVVLRTAAAAFLLLQLAHRHAVLRVGLAGATDWRSVALQLIAADAGTKAERRVELLTRATVHDPGNLAAAAALESAAQQLRHGDVRAYLGRLQRLVDRLGRADARPLELRLLFNIVSGRLNLLEQSGASDGDDVASAAATLDTLRQRLDEARSDAKLRPLADEIGAAAWPLYASLQVIAPTATPAGLFAETEPRSMVGYYERACLRMLQGDSDAALDDLAIATQGRRYRLAARADQSFARLHDDPRFKQLVGDPAPATFFELEAVQPHAAALARLGHSSAATLAALTPSPLARRLGIEVAESEALIGLAQLHEWLRARGADAPAQTFLLTRVDVPTPAALQARLASVTEFHETLRAAAAPYTVVAPSAATLLGWRAPPPSG